MIADGQRVMLDGWWLSLFPGLAITTLVISLALIGDGIQQLGSASS
jgi:peptide/nickel transport system permease protein